MIYITGNQNPQTELIDISNNLVTDRALNNLCWAVFNRPDFWTCTGAKNNHHVGVGGLARHALEVAIGSLCMAKMFADIDEEALFVACLYHDIGKIEEYVQVEDGWEYTSHKKQIGHLSKSFAMFYHDCQQLKPHIENWDEERIQGIGHLILAHHGRQEWGSPVLPQTAAAYIIHFADMLSAEFGQ
jgi:3'-5' exoribonuclease